MQVSQKCQYALRAVFELSRRYGQGPVKNADIAEAQAIPPRFLEVILGQLRGTGVVDSRRGKAGGYFLARHPDQLTIGEIIRLMGGAVGPVDCVAEPPEKSCPLHGQCVFLPIWEQARKAVVDVYDNVTFQDLLEKDEKLKQRSAPSYVI